MGDSLGVPFPRVKRGTSPYSGEPPEFPTPTMSKDFIVTVDVYMMDYETKIDAIDKVMATLHAGGLEGDVLNTIEGEPDEAGSKNSGWRSAVRTAAGA